MKQPERAMELISVIRCRHFGDQRIKLRRRPAIEALLRHRLRISSWVEVVQISHQESQSVADFAVFISKFLQHFRTGWNVILVVDAAAPKAKHIGAMAINFFCGGHAIRIALTVFGAVWLYD